VRNESAEMREVNKKEKALKWLKQFESGKRWLNTVKAAKTGSTQTQLEYAYRLRKFCNYAKKNPDHLIAERKEQLSEADEGQKRKTEELVNEFFNFQSEKSNRLSAKAYHGALRSFYKYNYVPLRIETPRARSRKINPITLEEFKQIDAIANPRDRALLRFMKDSGLSTEDVVVFNYGDIRKEFEEGQDFIHIKAVRQKTQVNYDTFIGPNAVEALKIYFRIRRTQGETFTDETPLFLSHGRRKGGKERLDGNSIRTIFTRLKQRIGIVVSPHRIRKLFSSYMALKVRHPVVLKYWMGHSVGTSDIEGSYVLPPLEEQRKLYMESYGQIDIRMSTSEDDLRIKIVLDDLRKTGRFSENYLKQLADEWLGKPPEIAIRRISLEAEAAQRIAERGGFNLLEDSFMISKDDINEEMERIKRERLRSKTATNGGCANGEHCQKIVNEMELGGMLAQGWRVAAVLPSGKIVVSNE
jgi:site-specific recombinase XerD